MMENNIEEWDDKKISRRQALSFSLFGLASAAGLGAYFSYQKQPLNDNGLRSISCKAYALNEKVNGQLYSHKKLAPTYPRHMASPSPRINGTIGIDTELTEEYWELSVNIPSQKTPRMLKLEQIKKMPKTELTFEFKCIEGWSEIVNYAGVRLSVFLEIMGLSTEGFEYIGLETPDQQYYVGLDMASALHPQTILCYEMNGQPLIAEHGAPLRLITPIKYGVKSIKQIGNIYLSKSKTKDYWHEYGYDYDLSL